MTYDTKCADLARYFLSAVPAAYLENGKLDEVIVNVLAIDIQHGVDSWLDSYIRTRK